MEILGGYVEALVSKWEISRSLANQMKGKTRNYFLRTILRI